MVTAFGLDLCAAQKSGRPLAKVHPASSKRRRKPNRRVLRVHQAFVASKTLRPMAQQLLRERTPAAYQGVEAYARLHNSEDAGSLAWFVVAYAHMMDRNAAEALEPLRRARVKANELADYITYYQATALQQTGDSAQAVALLRDFEQKFSGSILLRDVHLTRHERCWRWSGLRRRLQFWRQIGSRRERILSWRSVVPMRMPRSP